MKKVLENKIKKILNNFKGDFKIDSRDIKKGLRLPSSPFIKVKRLA